MKCNKCNQEVVTSDSYCPYCGEPLKSKVEDQQQCKQCGKVFTDNASFCSACGTKRDGVEVPVSKPSNLPTSSVEMEFVEIHEENVTRKEINYFKNPIIWIVSITLFVVSILLSMYVDALPRVRERNTESDVTEKAEKEKIQITNSELVDFDTVESTSSSLQQQNNNLGGYVAQSDSAIYVATSQGVICYNLDFEEQKVVLNEDVSNLYVEGNMLYYVLDYAYYCLNMENEENTLLFTNIDILQHVGDYIYYQKGTENGLHAYHKVTQDEKRLSEVETDRFYVDEESQTIYYPVIDGEQPGIYKMDLDGQNQTVLVAGEFYSSVVVNNTLYTSGYTSFNSYTIEGEEERIIKEIVLGDYLVDTHGIWYIGIDEGLSFINETGQTTSLLETDIIFVQAIGQYTLCWVMEDNEWAIYVVDKDGNCAFLTEDYIYDEWDEYSPSDSYEDVDKQDKLKDF